MVSGFQVHSSYFHYHFCSSVYQVAGKVPGNGLHVTTMEFLLGTNPNILCILKPLKKGKVDLKGESVQLD